MNFIHPDLEVVPLPKDRLLAFHTVIGEAELDGHTFEITRDLTGTHLSFREQVDGLTVIHTLDIKPVIQAALEEIASGGVS